MDDQRIIALFEARAQEAIEQTENAYGSLCRSLAGKLLRSEQDVEECVHDTYLALWNAIPPAKPDPLSAYIAKVTRNLALKKLEHLSAEKRGSSLTVSLEELDTCIPFGPTPETALEEKELARAIQGFLQKQSKQNRILFLRRYYFLESVKEIAQQTGYSEALIKSSLLRTRQKLKSFLIKEGWIDER